MTQKEELIKAMKMAVKVKGIASRLRNDAKDYDVRFPLSYADDLERIANEFLKLK